MALKFLIDILTGNLVLVNIPTAATPVTPESGNPVGLLLAITYP